MADGLKRELAATRVPGTELFATLEWMRGQLPRAVDAYDRRLLGPPPFPPEVGRAPPRCSRRGRSATWFSTVAQQPVVANNFGYGFRDSLPLLPGRVGGRGARDRQEAPLPLGRRGRPAARE